jgi:signal transduction histidine kinase
VRHQSHRSAGFTDEDLAVARAIAAQVAGAYENARRYQALRGEVARRAEVENEVRILNQDLERRVPSVLRSSKSRIASSRRSRTSVAHDLRAPLRLIHAHVQMLRDYRGSPTAREPLIHLDQITRGAREMSALIDGLLALSRISHMEMRREVTSLDELVKRAVNQVRPGQRRARRRMAAGIAAFDCLRSRSDAAGVRQPDRQRREVLAAATARGDRDRNRRRRRARNTFSFATTASASTCATRASCSGCSSACIGTTSSREPASAGDRQPHHRAARRADLGESRAQPGAEFRFTLAGL